MSDYTHILCALDLSADAARVGTRAVVLARLCKAQLTVVHIVDYAAIYGTAETPLPAELPWLAAPFDKSLTDVNAQAAVGDAEEALAQLIQSLMVEPLLSPVTTEVMLSSSAQDAIRELAYRGGADLIVVGSHGSHGLSLFGHASTSAGVLRNAPCDVLVVQTDTTDHSEALA